MPERAAQAITVRALVVSGVLTVIAGVVLGFVLDPLLGLIAIVGAIDLVLAKSFATGKLAAPGAAVVADGAVSDPSCNPYARGD